MKEALDHEGYTTPFALFTSELFDGAGLRRWAGHGITLSDDHPEL